MRSAIVIGGGIVGAAVAHDLSLRGVKVTLLERDSIAYGTSGRTHGLLHSGCRYVKTPSVARECYMENLIMRRIGPDLFETNGGYFVGITDEDLEYAEEFLDGCEAAGIPVREVKPELAIEREPNLNPKVRKVFEVPDATFDPLKVVLSFLATAKRNGAEVRPFNEVIGFKVKDGEVSSVEVFDRISEKRYRLSADVYVNATGPWAGLVAKMFGGRVSVTPTIGVMVSIRRVSARVINRLNPPSDGDIVLPQRRLSVIGTTSKAVGDPDLLPKSREDVELLLRRGAEMLPLISREEVKAVYVSARPLVGEVKGSGREVSREFSVIDHEAADGVGRVVSVVGGKFTTARLMAEKAGDLIVEKLGMDAPSKTKEVGLLPHYEYFEVSS